MVRRDGVHWSEEHPDRCDGDGVLDERGDEPDDELEPGVLIDVWTGIGT